ncbi:uncharacterized protein LODBEIA_P54570 [Lodderomyces beijingensis]|uniref:DNA damage response protein kinase DUN1 n=1 Tax=Lodderomyces beijingensis TaxID=1775926 RepID=A0ABP0ZSW9_9ASCO
MSLIRKRKLLETQDLEPTAKTQPTIESTTSKERTPIAKLYSTRTPPQAALTIPHQQRVVIGRSKTCDVQISGLDVSSRHCSLNLVCLPQSDSQREYMDLCDLSSNGMWVNGERMDGAGSAVVLKSGDKLTFAKTGGSWIFRYNVDGEGEEGEGNTSDVMVEQSAKKRKTTRRLSFFDEYILGRQLGSGHYAVVKEARCKRTGEVVAVKIFHPNKTGKSEEEAKLQQEMNLLLAINHPNIVQYRGHYTEPHSNSTTNTYLVLEKMNSGELFQRIINKTRLGAAETRAIFTQLLAGLKYLHDRDIIHRDIKPENILLDIVPRKHADERQLGPWDPEEIDVRVKIADFGLAKFIGKLKFTNTLCGTPAYVAPEILRLQDKRNYSTKVDLWSSGVLLYVCLSGFPPFSDELAPPNMKEQILSGKYAFYSPYFDDISDTALDLITNLLKVDPADRFNVDETLNHEWFTEKD